MNFEGIHDMSESEATDALQDRHLGSVVKSRDRNITVVTLPYSFFHFLSPSLCLSFSSSLSLSFSFSFSAYEQYGAKQWFQDSFMDREVPIKLMEYGSCADIMAT